MQELDVVVLVEDIPEEKLKAGDRGTILDIWGSPPVYLVEFLDKSPVPLAITVVEPGQVALAPGDTGEEIRPNSVQPA